MDLIRKTAAVSVLLLAPGLSAPGALAGFADLPELEHGSRPGPMAASTAGADRGTERGVGAGKATWYGPGFQGRTTASGERFDGSALTAAHRSLPFGSLVRVTSAASGRSVVVRINDRGPTRRSGAIIDLSRASAAALGMTGTAHVRLARLGP